jgi:hypothetical protein
MFKVTWTHSVPFGGKRYRFSGRPAPKNRNRKASGKTQWLQKPLHENSRGSCQFHRSSCFSGFWADSTPP